TTSPWQNAVTSAPGLRVPSPFAGRQMLRILRESGGFPRIVSDGAIVEAQLLLARTEGIWTAPGSPATVVALLEVKMNDERRASTRVGHSRTGAGIKYSLPSTPPPIHLEGPAEELLARVRRAIGT